METKIKKHRGRNSQQEIGLKKLEEIHGPKSSLKKANKKKDRYSVLLEDTIKNKSVERKRKKESLDEINIKYNLNTQANTKSTDKNKQKAVLIKEDPKNRKEKPTDNSKSVPRKQSYYEKYKNKPKETFYSTSKNPKINEILKRLKENGQIKLQDDTNTNVVKYIIIMKEMMKNIFLNIDIYIKKNIILKY